MKRYLMVILMAMILTLGMAAGCRQEATPAPITSATSVPTRTQDEVCALVYTHLETKVNLISPLAYRMELTDTLSKARPYFFAEFEGNGKWQVWALGYSVDINLDEYLENFTLDERLQVEVVSPTEREEWVKSHEQWFLEQHFPSNPSWVKTGVHRVYYYRGGLWNFYEASGVIEPANGGASELLRYIRRWAK